MGRSTSAANHQQIQHMEVSGLWLLVITGINWLFLWGFQVLITVEVSYNCGGFYMVINFINGVFLVLITGITWARTVEVSSCHGTPK